MLDPDHNQQWQQVFEDGIACENCSYNKRITNRHPYGESTALETLRDCKCPCASLCPGIEHNLDDTH